MHIRFFNTYEPVSTHYRDLVPYLAAQGVEIEIIVSKAEYRQGRKLHDFMQNQPNVRLIETPSWGLRVEQGAVAKTVIIFTYLLIATLYGLLGPSTDKNVFLSQPPLIAFLGYILHKVRRQPYDCIVMDVYPQIAVAMGLLQAHTWHYRSLKQAAAVALQDADSVIVIGRCMRDVLVKNGVSVTRIHYIPNWADHETIYPVEHIDNRVRRDLEWQGKFVILYAGNIGIPQYFDDLLQAAATLQAQHDLLFAFIGSGVRVEEIRRLITDRALTNVVIHPFLHEKYQLAEILSAGDVHFVTLGEGIGGLAVPSKAYSILAAGRPIIYQGECFGEIVRMIDEEQVGMVVPLAAPERLKNVILTSYENDQKRKQQQTKARALAMGAYGRDHALHQYSAVLVGSNHQNRTNAVCS